MQNLPIYLQGIQNQSYDTSAPQNKAIFQPTKVESKIKDIAQQQTQTQPKIYQQDKLFKDVKKLQDAKWIAPEEAMKITLWFYKNKWYKVEWVDIDKELQALSPQEVKPVEEKNLLWKIWEGISNIWDTLKPFKWGTDIQWVWDTTGQLKMAWKMLANIPWDTVQLVWDITNLISNPKWAVKWVSDLAGSIVESWLNKLFGQDTYTTEERRQISQAVGEKLWEISKDPQIIQKMLEENPADVMLSLQWAGGILKNSSNTKIASIGQKLEETMKPIAAQKAIIRGTVKAWVNTWGFVLWKTSGLNPETLKTIFKNPDILTSWVTRESNAGKVLDAINNRVTELKWTGKWYEAMRSGKAVANESDLIDATFKNVGDYKAKNLTKVDEAVINDAFSYIDRYKWDITDTDLLSLRQQIDSIKYDPITWAKRVLSPNGDRVITQIRKWVDELAWTKIKWLKELDATYWKEVSDLKDVKNLLFKKNWELKDNYISTLSNLTSKNNLPKLEKIKKLVPEIESEINAVKALEDVEYAKWRAIGNYTQWWAIALWVSWAVNPASAIWLFIISNPTIVSKAVSLAWYSARTVGSITEKIKNGIKLTSQEAQIVSKAIQNQINEQALKWKEALGNTLGNVQVNK